MSTPRKVSAAGRLLALLNRAVQQKGGTAAYDVWATVFELQSNERAAVYEAIGRVFRLLDLARAEVRAHAELDQDLYLGAINNIDVILQGPLSNQWVNTAGPLQAGNLIALQFVAEQLNRLSTELEAEPAKLTALRQLIESAIADLLSSDIDASLRSVLVQRLEEARRAIVLYTVDGADGLRSATEGAVGALIFARQAAQQHADKKPMLQYIEVVNQLLELVNNVTPYLPLVAPAVRALLAPPV